ncbi:MAG: hypothetical protein QW123_03215 [Desulfurococcaceae archaeon]
MIKRGRVIFIGDEALELIARAAGLDAYLFKANCEDLNNWLSNNIQNYDVIVYLDLVAESCSSFRRILNAYSREKLFVELEYPLKKEFTDPKKYYKELAKKDLGVEIEL